jgi:hypothetical protein
MVIQKVATCAPATCALVSYLWDVRCVINFIGPKIPFWSQDKFIRKFFLKVFKHRQILPHVRKQTGHQFINKSAQGTSEQVASVNGIRTCTLVNLCTCALV